MSAISSNIPQQIPEAPSPKMEINVQQEPDLVIQVEPVPDLNITVETLVDVDENANLLKELEAALLNDAKIDVNTVDKKRVLKVSTHLEKEGTDAKAPIVAHTYTTQKTKRVYNPATKKMEDQQVDVTCWKFKTTWEMEVLNSDGTTKTVTRTAWMKTPVELPKKMKDPTDMNHSQYLALLHVKAVRHAYKAALNPLHYHHQRTQETIEFLRNNNTLRIDFKPNPNQWQLQLINLQKGKMAYYAVIKTKDAQNTPSSIEIDYYKTATKVNDAGTGWINSPSNIHSGAYNVAQKHREQRIISHDERITRFEALKNASSTEFLQKFKEYQDKCQNNPTYGLITAQSYMDLAKKEAKKKKKEFDLSVSQLAVQLAGHPILQMIEALTGLVPNSVIKQNIEDKINTGLEAYNNETNLQMKQIQGMTLASEMKDLCKAAKNLETIKDDIVKKRDQLDLLAAEADEDNSIRERDLQSLNKTIAKLEETLEIYQPLINVQPQIAAIAASLGHP
ncbi:MAG TPA: hypothetical protein VIH61_00430, partial [Waddliaceae bacterium]